MATGIQYLIMCIGSKVFNHKPAQCHGSRILVSGENAGESFVHSLFSDG